MNTSNWWQKISLAVRLHSPQVTTKKSGVKRNIGLTNQGLTCFINSSLQCLFNIKQFADYFINADKQYNSDDLNRQLIYLAKQMWGKSNNKLKQYNTEILYHKIRQTFQIYRINQYKMMDSPQFIQNLLNYLRDNPIKTNSKQISKIFQGQFLTTIVCKQYKQTPNDQYCNYQSVCLKQSFFSIPLTVAFSSKCLKQQTKSNTFNQMPKFKFLHHDLISCLDNFSKKGRLEGNDKWYCKKCKKDTESQRAMRVYKTGKVVIIHLLRFTDNTKYNQIINYNQYLQQVDLLREKGQIRYHLTGVICHLGYTMKSGHYYSFCYNEDEKKWYRYSDSHIHEASYNQHLSHKDAYVLFYERFQQQQ